MDIIKTRKGLTVEIGNTDAEGRVVLSDALAEGASENPALMIDFATLTGAARIALGTDLPAFFCNDDAFAAEFLAAGEAVGDPVWRMPLWPGYRSKVESRNADLTNAPEGRFGGAITAALFLERFSQPVAPWAHLDIMAWNASSRPGRPEGGDAISMRAAYEAIKRRLSNSGSA
jgi:leucyl aminopeptidase